MGESDTNRVRLQDGGAMFTFDLTHSVESPTLNSALHFTNSTNLSC